MKQLKLTFFLTVLMSMFGTKAFAYDIEVKNADGKTIYYTYINDGKELEVAYSSSYSGNINIPSEVTYLGQTRKVTSIGSSAFYRCSGLSSVTIPNSVTHIGAYAFYHCSGLTSITIPKSVTFIEFFAFGSCSGLTSVTIGNSVTGIGDNAFDGCYGLTSVTLGNSVTTIGQAAFYGCSSLTSITIPNSVTFIGSTAFSNCSGLTKVIVNDIAAWCGIYFDGYRANPLYYAHHLYNNKNQEIKNLLIPNNVTSIGDYAFYECSGLTSVTIGNSVTRIGYHAFEDCSGITSVTIGSSVTSIGNSAFLKCSGLTSVNIPNSVTSIGSSAFSGCFGLTSVTIGNSVTGIGNNAFYGCSGLTSFTIPNSVTNIGENTFYGLSNVKRINIGKSVTTFGKKAFANCCKLEDVYCYAERYPTTTPTDIFENSYVDYVTLHVPEKSVTQYKNHAVWGQFMAVVPITDEEMAVETIDSPEQTTIRKAYDINGRQLSEPQRGLNIIRMSDGTTRKVVVK